MKGVKREELNHKHLKDKKHNNWKEKRSLEILANLVENLRKSIEIKILKYLNILIDKIKHKRTSSQISAIKLKMYYFTISPVFMKKIL